MPHALLESLLQAWRQQLSLWSQSGALSRAAEQALLLGGTPERLRELVGRWSAGSFEDLPPVVVLPASAMSTAAGAYALSTGTIYLNREWLQQARREQVMAVLTEELGHHLDGLLNSGDSPGDEGELFAKMVIDVPFEITELQKIQRQEDRSLIIQTGKTIQVEQSSPVVLEVNTLVDENDGSATKGNGLSLRDAIAIANKNKMASHIIKLKSGSTYLLTQLQSPGNGLDILITEGSITIETDGAAKASILNGMSTRTSQLDDSSLILNAGGSFNRGNGLTLNNLNISNTLGRGIENVGQLLIKNCTISNNKAVSNGGGISNNGKLMVNNSLITNNSAANGGGIYNSGFNFSSITNSIISVNSATKGGGLFSDSGDISVENSIIIDNFAKESGGGIYNDHPIPFAVTEKLTLKDSIIIGNQAQYGGGLYKRNVFGGDNGVRSNSIIGGNIATKTWYNFNFYSSVFDINRNGIIDFRYPDIFEEGGSWRGLSPSPNPKPQPTITVGPGWIDIPSGSNQMSRLQFEVKLSTAHDKPITIDYYTLDGSASSKSTSQGRDFEKITRQQVFFAPGETKKFIEVKVFGSKAPSDFSFELFARDTAYREWKEADKGIEVDKKYDYNDPGYEGYRIHQIFENSTGFNAVGLTSDEKFFLVLANPINAKINENSGTNLLDDIAKEAGGSSTEEYTDGESLVQYLSSKGEPLLYTSGTIYDMAKQPILAIRGTAGLKDLLSDTRPKGIGYDQFISSKDAINQWLAQVSRPISGLTLRPHLTGHSLGGALSQWFGGSYSEDLGKITTFNSPGISRRSDINLNATNNLGVTHYITSGDLISIAGSAYLNGVWNLEKYLKQTSAITLEKHSIPVLNDVIIRNNFSKPKDLTRIVANGKTVDLGDFYFSYLPDADYFALQAAVFSLNPILAAALTFRGYVELERVKIGRLIESLTTASSRVLFPYNAAKLWGSAAWNTIKNQAKKMLVPFLSAEGQSNSSLNQKSSFLEADTLALVSTDTASEAIDNFWNAIPHWVNEAWQATTQWTGDAWESIDKWSPQAWQATTTWSANAWNNPFFIISNPSILENNSGVGDLVFKVLLSSPSAKLITVNYGTTNDTATAGVDYTEKTGTLTFAPGQISQDIVISVHGDTMIESNETFFINLSFPSNANIADHQGMATIFTDDVSGSLHIIHLAISREMVAEDEKTNLVYTFSRSGPTTAPLTVSYSVSGTATLGADYTGIASIPDNKSVTFLAGSATATLTVNPTSDTIVEPDETVALTLAADSGYTIGTPAAVVGTITNDDPRITLTVSPASVTEDGADNLVYTFTRSGTGDLTTTPLTVNYTVGGTASLGMDYTGINPTGPSQSITFAAGSTTARVTVDPTADTEIEPHESVALTLVPGTGYAIGTRTAVVGTITNDDPKITLALSPALVLEDGSDKLVYTFARTGITTSSLTVNYTIGGTASLGQDYTGISSTAIPKTITFAAGASTAIIELDPTADTTIEADETVSLTLAPGTGYFIGSTSAVTGTIRNDDIPLITLAVSPASVTEDGLTNLMYTFTRNGSGLLTSTPLLVNYTVGGTADLGTDYTGIGTTGATRSITFAAGATTASLTVNPTADATVEPDETVALTLAAGTGYTIGTTTAVVGTISNDDPRVTLNISPTTVLEDEPTNLIYTFRRSGPTTSALTVNYTVTGTANLGVDYTGISPLEAIKTITFAPGAAIARLTVNPTTDGDIEPDETVALTLAPGSDYTLGTTTAVVGTIRNDDPKISLAVAPASVTEDGPANLIYTFSRTGAPTEALTVKYTVGGTARLGLDYTGIHSTGSTKTVTFAAGAATATIEVDPTPDTAIESEETVDLTLVAGTGYTLGAKTWASGTIQNDDISSSVTTTLGATGSSLLLTGNAAINGTGNSLNNTLTGNSKNNRLTGLLGADVLTGGGTTDSDVFAYTSLNESLLGTGNAFDQITDFNSNDRLSAPATVAKQQLTNGIGIADSLTEAAMAALLTATTFPANSVAAFTATGQAGSFIAMNDGRSGYQADSDAIVFLRNYVISSTNAVALI